MVRIPGRTILCIFLEFFTNHSNYSQLLISITFNFFQVKSISNCGRLNIATSSSYQVVEQIFPLESRLVCWKMTDLRETRGPPPPASVDHQTWWTEAIQDRAGLVQLLSNSGQTGTRAAQPTIFQNLEQINGWWWCLVAKSCPNLLQPHGLSSLHGILQARILEWVPCSVPGDLSNPGIELVSLTSPALAGRLFTTSITWEDLLHSSR